MAKILVIDDSAIMRDLLSEFLSEEGFEVHCTEDSDSGIEMALNRDFDICVCDMHLPSKSGYEIFCEVTSRKPDLPFIITDSMPDQQSDRARRSGAYRYLKKPFELDQLRELIRAVLQPARTK